MKKLLTLTLLMLSLATIAAARNMDSSERKLYSAKKSYNVFFDINKSAVDKAYMSNTRTLDQIKADCDSSFLVGMPAPDTIYIHATSSPDGPVAFNKELAHQRALSTKAAIQNLIPQLKNSHFIIKYQVENWDALRQILLADENFPQKEQMLKTLSDPAQADNLHRALKQYSEGWAYYVKHHIYSLRNAAVSLSVLTSMPEDEFTITAEEHLPATEEKDTVQIIKQEPEPVKVEDPEPEIIQPAPSEPVKKPFYIGVKNNMLYDAAIVPNIGAEFYVGKNISVVANWMYSWWKDDKTAWYWRTYGGDLGVRYWFGKAAKEKPLTGHHVGLYGQIITYDFEVGGRGYLADRWTFGGGIEYGYSLPVARRFNIDFTIGAGYLGGEFKEYLPIDGHYVWQATKYRRWIGPTKAEISLVWLIGRGNANERKGGKR